MSTTSMASKWLIPSLLPALVTAQLGCSDDAGGAADASPDAVADSGQDTTGDPAPDRADAREDAAPDVPGEDLVTTDTVADSDATVDLADDSPTIDPLAALSDEFDNASSSSAWQTRHVVESAPAHHDTLAIDTVTAGFLTIDPNGYVNPDVDDGSQGAGWFQDSKGPMLFKEVTGDFVVQAWIRVGTVADIATAPSGTFNAGGFVVRDPASYDSGEPDALGNEAWVMYNLGNQDGSWATESKTTLPDGGDGDSQSDSSIFLTPITSLQGRLAVCRIGSRFRFFRNLEGDGDDWTEEVPSDATLFRNGTGLNGPDYSDVFDRQDLPATLQVGLIANRYTDGEGSPVRVEVDWVRFATPRSVADCTRALAP